VTPLRSSLTPSFRKLYAGLPKELQELADDKCRLFSQNPFHSPLAFQTKGKVWSAAIGRPYRAIARRFGNDVYWVWIGSHEDYNNILGRLR
jgi:hypothetical protein